MQCHFDDQEVCKMVIVGLQQLDKFEGAWAKFDPEGKNGFNAPVHQVLWNHG